MRSHPSQILGQHAVESTTLEQQRGWGNAVSIVAITVVVGLSVVTVDVVGSIVVIVHVVGLNVVAIVVGWKTWSARQRNQRSTDGDGDGDPNGDELVGRQVGGNFGYNILPFDGHGDYLLWEKICYPTPSHALLGQHLLWFEVNHNRQIPTVHGIQD
ncbi:hypothetical protein AXG93_2145s1730 [Marchantia polymorpha subsp. ruderalis]|uniref:Uncharacterized protein n=1 Tax=Marchantia polymorpha subsp. ruderalis TaxID=1480154 RepID=A0A176VYJ6_MARPO|nr:hypothetical protein AXG93_2145s1730 [Marchantia polymorpha subsp. ruderalis]